MSLRDASEILLRTVAGLLGSALAAWAAFGGVLLEPALPPFRSLTIGLAFSGIAALYLSGRRGQALFIPVAWAAAQLGLTWDSGALRSLAQTALALALGGGLFVIAVIYERLAARNWRVGKFLVVGPLLGGLYMAVTPLGLLGVPGHSRAVAELWMNLQIGLVTGDGAAFLMELVDWALTAVSRKAVPAG